MFGLFSSSRRTQPTHRRSVRLSLENLENRDCPTTGVYDPLASTVPPPVPPAPIILIVPPITPPSAPLLYYNTPLITLDATYGTEHQMTLQGQVNLPNPAGLTVTFEGVVTGQTTTDASGNYQITLTASAAFGSIIARSVSGGQTASTMIMANNIAAYISNFTAVEGAPNLWTFNGLVTDEHAAGLTVSLGGAPASLIGVTTTVNADGWFHVSVQLSDDPSDSGMVTARIAADWWGLASNTAFTYIT